VRFIISSALVVFGWLAPRRVWRAFRLGYHQREGCLFAVEDYEGLLSLRLDALRERLGLPAEGLATEPRRLHAHAPVTNGLRHAKRT
jgi:hypothetical protein